MPLHDGSDQLTITDAVVGDVGVVDVDEDASIWRPLWVMVTLIYDAAGPVTIDRLWFEGNDAVEGSLVPLL